MNKNKRLLQSKVLPGNDRPFRVPIIYYLPFILFTPFIVLIIVITRFTLLVVNILLLPIIILKSLAKLFRAVFLSIGRIGLKKRGRKRITPLIPFYLHKLSHSFKQRVPKSTRTKIAVAFILLIIFLYSVMVAKFTSQLPSPDHLRTAPQPLTTSIYDRNGKLLYQFYEGQNRKLVSIDDLPQNLISATIAVEDKNFFNHHGFDILGLVRAIKSTLVDEQIQGGSTITQQLIKNTLLNSDRTLKRKIKEIILAYWTEVIYNKQQILQMYFNEVPFGGTAWGIDAAAEMYFDKEPKDLTLAESAYLAGLPAAPTEYSPFGKHPEKGKQRQVEVLNKMTELGYINPEQARQAQNHELKFRSHNMNIKAPHFVMFVRSLLSSRYGERTVSQGGLKIITTLDLSIQEMVEEVVSKNVRALAKLNVSNGAAMVSDAKSGQILAMVGSKNYYDPDGGNYNAALALRSSGSAIKPVTYATAFKQGYNPGSYLLDAPITFVNPWGQSYSPVNYDGRFHGLVTIRSALANSYNIPAVKILNSVGVQSMIDTAKDMGVTTFDNALGFGVALTLGANVTMLDMMSVYNTLATNGIRNIPQPILTITDSYGNVLEDNRIPEGKAILQPEIAYLLTHILSDNQARVPVFGTKSLLEIPRHTVAVKTGTSDLKRDNWAFGYTPDYVVGTWVGNFNNAPMHPQLASGITGATPIWHDIMVALLKDKKDVAFDRPPGIVETFINGKKELTIAGQKLRELTEIPKKESLAKN